MKTTDALLLCSCALALLGTLPSRAGAQEQQMLEDLRGTWKFRIGDDAKWAGTSWNDDGWDQIYAPSPWEDEGYPGYDGYAWYRKRFTAKQDWAGKTLRLHLGTIDDADEVYLNGVFIAFGGQFPPHYISEYGWTRDYPLPARCLKFGAVNVIAVRVYDSQLSGGITGGKLGIYQVPDPLRAEQSLGGTWKLREGDDPAWKEPACDDASWHDAAVPAFWETQGMKDYDGFAWYRVHFRPSSSLDGKTLILLLGKIDDIDEAYLNGERIGKTGSFTQNPRSLRTSNQYKELRAYTVPSGLLKFGQDNILAVRVFDAWLHGGIYDEPVGLITRDAYLDWKSRHRDRKNPWDFFRKFFE